MVQLMNSGTIWPDSDTDCRKKLPVKLEVEDSLEEEHGPLNKRSKLDSSQLQWSSGPSSFPIPPSQYNPLDEPSPLGLRLRKSPSLLDLIQMRLSQGNTAKFETQGKKDHKGTAVSGSTDKLKASNFPASVLRIGNWEYASKYEGDLVAKCYFAKHKLVWEVLDGGLKSKIEIQWSDIVALKGNYPDNEPGTLDIVLARQPLFFRETNPQPRKHTLWQATTDFTSGQASMYRRHFLRCPQGMLGKHFEKLIQCDPRLNFLSQQPEIALESPYFEPRGSLFDDPSESNIGFGLKSEGEPTLFGMRDPALASGAQPSSSKNEQQDPVGRPSEQFSRETPSPSSVMDTHAIEEIGSHGTEELKGLSQSDQIKVPGLHPSMSMSDLVNHIEHRISEQITSGNPIKLENRYILDEITQSLFSDSQLLSASDEQSIMSRVNSLCCLLQKDAVTVQNLEFRIDNGLDIPSDERIDEPNSISVSSCGSKVGVDFSAPEGESNDVSGCKQAPAMSRKDSVGELLLNLPRIASLPQFLFNISDDFNNQAR